MDLNQLGIATNQHLKALFNLLLELEDGDPADMPFKDDIFRQVFNKGFVHTDTTVDVELKMVQRNDFLVVANRVKAPRGFFVERGLDS